MGPCSVFSTAGCVALCYVPNWSKTDIVSVLTICLIALVIVTARGEPSLSSGREELCLETITGRNCSHLIIPPTVRELKRKPHFGRDYYTTKESEYRFLRSKVELKLKPWVRLSENWGIVPLLFYSDQSSSFLFLIIGALLCVLAVTNYRAEYRTNDRGVRKLKIVTLTFAAAGCSNWSGRALRPPRGWEPKYSLCTVEANLWDLVRRC